MRYTDRQVRCLEAMGLVPWVDRHAVRAPHERPVAIDEAAAAPSVPATARATAPVEREAALMTQSGTANTVPDTDLAASEFMPEDAQLVGEWLLKQSLIAEPSLAGLTSSARVLVLVDSGQDGQLLESRQASLLDAMLKAIDLDRSSTRWLHALSPALMTATTPTAMTVTWQEATAGVSLAILLSRVVVASDNVDDQRLKLPEGGLPVFRIAHPEVLQARPDLKRQAWTVLKAVRQALV